VPMPHAPEDLRLLGSKELAELLGLHRRTVQAWLKEGRLPGMKLGRDWKARVSDVHAYLDAQRAATSTKEGL
jgi:excisionase family DNA binding protein